MRSNGSVHIGNDTFLSVTRDCTDCVHLFTGRFTPTERAAELALPRRVRFFASSSVDLTAAEMARCTAAFDRLQARRRASTATEEAGGLLRYAPQGRADDPAAGEAEDADTCLLTRHSLHASCDGQRVAAVSNRHRQHYVMDISHDPVGVAEFETEEVVRSAAWHPTVPYLLLTLSVRGILTVYDASAAHLNVLFQRAHQIDLKPMLHTLLADKRTMVGHQQQTHREQRSRSPAARTGTRARPTPAPETAAAAAAGVEGQGRVIDRHHPSPPLQRPTGAYGIDEFGLPERSPAPAAAAASQEGDTSTRARSGEGLLADVRATLRGGPARVNSTVQRPGGDKKRSPASPLTKQQQQAGEGAAAERAKGSPTAGAEAGSGLTAGDAVSRLSATTFYGATAHTGRPTLHTQGGDRARSKSPRALHTTRAEADAVAFAPVGSAASATNTCLDLVDMCIVDPTLSLPPTLLLLSSSGDVFSVKLNPYSFPAMGKSVASDGAVPLTAAAKQAAAEARQALERMPHLCHIIQGRGRWERRPPARATAPDTEDDKEGGGGSDRGSANGSPLPDMTDTDEAVAVRCCRLDEDAGLHAVVVVYASGLVRGAWVDEADLIARQRVRSCVADFRAYGASGFTIHLGSALSARSFLSPTVPTTTHTVQVSARGNVLLLRAGGGDHGNEAAYLIAFPVLDRHRAGWSYWRPTASMEAARAAAEALRLPLVSTDPTTVPEPLALRVPLDVRGASLSLGATELLLFPELAAEGETDTCPRAKTVTLAIPSLLRSALYARAVGVQWAPATSQPTLGAMVEGVFECHRRFLSGCPPAAVDEQTATLAARVQAGLSSVRTAETAVVQRQAKLQARAEVMQQRVQRAMDDLGAWTATLLDAIAHRRGPEAVRTANTRLGLAHDILCERESHLAQRWTQP